MFFGKVQVYITKSINLQTVKPGDGKLAKMESNKWISQRTCHFLRNN